MGRGEGKQPRKPEAHAVLSPQAPWGRLFSQPAEGARGGERGERTEGGRPLTCWWRGCS